MPLPYKDRRAGFTAFIAHVEELGQRLGGTANSTTARAGRMLRSAPRWR
jgi:hypothetical protein